KEAEKAGEGAINLSIQSVARVDMQSHIQNFCQNDNSMLLAVYGEKDDVIDPSPTRDLNGSLSNIRQIGLSDSKHFPMLDEAAKFHRLLKDFLDVENDLSALELKEEWRRRTR
ncbi:MAG: alpha/beta hydrolase, partial [Chloroflexi bacterium]|nr:alpha/beta hydrolase [Chloroflexota bacterium]